MRGNLWDRFESHMLNEGVTKARLEKLKSMFKACERGISVSLEKAKRQHIEEFLDRLNKDQFKNTMGKTYSGSTKSDIKKFLKQFYKWLLGDNEAYPQNVSWIRTRIRKDEAPQDKPTISIEQVKKLAGRFYKIQYKVLVLLLFESGFRIMDYSPCAKKISPASRMTATTTVFGYHATKVRL